MSGPAGTYKIAAVTIQSLNGDLYFIDTTTLIPNTYRTYSFICTGAPTLDGVPSTIGCLVEALATKGCWGVLIPDAMSYGAVPNPKFVTQEPA